MKKRLCVTPCGSAKIWRKQPNIGAIQAKDVYIGSFAKACQEYAATFFDDWVILSAKFGFLLPTDFVSGDYNISFNKPNPDVVTIEALKQQIINKRLGGYDEIVILGGKKYSDIVTKAFGRNYDYFFPLSNCKGIGYMIQRLKLSIHSGKEIENIK
ncbi:MULTISPECIES: DUF6884 domain-containing protein [Brevibacillus]|nr:MULTISPECIES: DUF6884 domain-containing protein [Brevibacillus]